MIKLFKSPLGIAITAVSALLIASPEARKMTRRLAVKGTAAIMGLADQIKDASKGVRKQIGSVTEDAGNGDTHQNHFTHHAVDTLHHDLPIKDAFNVINDEALKNAFNPAE